MAADIIPVVLFAYKRPEHLKKVLEGLRINKVPLIFAFCDGPRSRSEEEPVKKVRGLLQQVDWCEIKTVEHPKNIGLAQNIRSGITAVMEQFDKVVVVEDDIVLKAGAYEYVSAALRHYENSENVMSISMWCDDFLSAGQPDTGFFSKRFVCWGWGTYRKYWQTYVEEPMAIFNKAQRLGLKPLEWGADIEAQVNEAEKRRLWYVGYLLQHFINDKISYFPKHPLVTNIGIDGSGENILAGALHPVTVDAGPVRIPAIWPEPVMDKKIAKKFARFFEHRTKSGIYYFFKRLKSVLSTNK
jgi:hypothetical protein